MFEGLYPQGRELTLYLCFHAWVGLVMGPSSASETGRDETQISSNGDVSGGRTDNNSFYCNVFPTSPKTP